MNAATLELYFLLHAYRKLIPVDGDAWPGIKTSGNMIFFKYNLLKNGW
jgi:hypothetical protein